MKHLAFLVVLISLHSLVLPTIADECTANGGTCALRCPYGTNVVYSDGGCSNPLAACCFSSGNATECSNRGGRCGRVGSSCRYHDDGAKKYCPGGSQYSACCIDQRLRDADRVICYGSPWPLPRLALENAKCPPVVNADFSRSSRNWGQYRDSGNRCHAGLDLNTRGSGRAVAVADGKITKQGYFYTCDNGKRVAQVMIWHEDLGVTINYGEINEDSLTTKQGDLVKAGQLLGKATYCGMLHIEVYEGHECNIRTFDWRPGPGRKISPSRNCRDEYWNEKPSELMDPQRLMDALPRNPGSECNGFAPAAEKWYWPWRMEAASDEVLADGDQTTLPTAAWVGICIGVGLLMCLIGMCLTMLVRRTVDGETPSSVELPSRGRRYLSNKGSMARIGGRSRATSRVGAGGNMARSSRAINRR